MTYLLGFAIAALVGLTGVGAGSLTAPLLILLFGQAPAVAVGTSLVFTMAIKLIVAPAYLKRRQVIGGCWGRCVAAGRPGRAGGNAVALVSSTCAAI